MKEFLNNLFWSHISLHLNCSISDSKGIIENVLIRFRNGKSELKDFSPGVKNALQFYLENYQYISND